MGKEESLTVAGLLSRVGAVKDPPPATTPLLVDPGVWYMT
jgi:hypothetical protein